MSTDTEALFFAIFLAFLLAIGASKKQAKQLVTITEFKPEDCSEFADVGDQIQVHYTGYLDSGAVFDTSRQADRRPFELVLGQGKVIDGWEQGIKGMCVGEKRRLVIPPHLAYGAEGHPPTIPAGATLTFETELVALEKKPFDKEVIFRTLKFFAIPAAVLYGIYYLYSKYQKLPTKRELKEERRRAKKKN